MTSSLNGNETGLIACYTFDSIDLVNATIPDITGSGHDAQIVGLNTSDIFETQQMTIQLTPKDQRQQPAEFFMKYPISFTYRWKTQYMVDVNTSSYLYEDLPVTRSMNSDASVNTTLSGIGDYWFDKGAELQLLMRKDFETKTLDGWLYGKGLPLGASGGRDNLTAIVLDDANTYLYHEIDSLQQGIAITWNMKVLTLYYTAAIGDELELTTMIEANKSSSGGTIDDITLENLLSDLTSNDTLYSSPYNGFVIDGPGDISYENMYLWGEYDQKLFPLIPGKVSLEWLVEAVDTSSTDTTGDTPNFRVEMTFNYPDESHYTYVIQTPGVELDTSTDDSWAFVQLAYTDGKNDDGSVTDGQYSAENDGTRSVLVFTCTDKNIAQGGIANIAAGDTDTEPVCTRVVEAQTLTDVLNSTTKTIPIGAVVGDDEHTAPHSGYVFYENAMVNHQIYDPDNLYGPIIPVNRQFTSDISDDLYIVWYQTISTNLALKMNGEDGYIAIADSDLINSATSGYSERTVEMWFMVDDKSINDRKQVLYEEGGYTNGLNFYIYDHSLYLGIYSESRDWWHVCSTDKIVSGQWHHAALVFDGATVTCYLDGDKTVFSDAYVEGIVDIFNKHTAGIGIGNVNDDTFFHDGNFTETGGHYFEGVIDELRLWSSARTESEIIDNMFNVLQGNESNLIAYYTFNDLDHLASDISNNGHDGTLTHLTGKLTSSNEKIDLGIYEPIYWPFTAIHYTMRWPELANNDHSENDAQASLRIVVASRLGSDGLDMYGADQFKYDISRYTDITIYNQPDKTLPGYNPNEEHAFLEKSLMYFTETPQPQAAFALRNDLNVVTQDETYTSNPYVLVQYFDVSEGEHRMWVYAVEMEDENVDYVFEYSMKAGELITAPYPLNILMGVTSPSLNWGHDGPGHSQRVYWEDHKEQAWAVSGDGSLYAHFWYSMRNDFWWPDDSLLCYDSTVPTDYFPRKGDYGNETTTWSDGQCLTVSVGTIIPYAVRNVLTDGWEEIEVTYNTSWPDELPILRVGETLTHSGGEAAEDGDSNQGLPGVVAFSSGQIIFDSVNPTLDEPQNLSTYAARLAQVLDKRSVDWTPASTFTDLFDATSGEIYLYYGNYFFKDLPAGLQQRIYYDPLNNELVLRGFLDGLTLGDSTLTSAPGAIYVLQPNILCQAEVETLKSLNTDSEYQALIDKLYEYSRDPKEISDDNTAYTVGLESTSNGTQHESSLGPGLALMPNDALLDPADTTLPDIMYVTLAENNHSDLGDAPISLHIIKIEKDNRYRGEIDILYPDNAFDEKINLRHTADFGANGDDIVFEWWYREDDGNDELPPDEAESGIWSTFPDESGNNGMGMNEISLSGAGAALLVDNLFFVRYRHTNCDTESSDTCWTDWAGAANNNPAKDVYAPQLSEGWVKRVIDRVNPFEARINDFYDEKNPATYSSMIQQVGQRYNGDVALNDDKDVIENVGLIQLYQTVLERAKGLSIDASQPYATSGISVAIQLATSRLAQFYMLLGNEAYTDSLDPTIGFTTSSNEYGYLAPSIFSFMDQMPDLIDEELALLRGRDEYGASPTFNRLMWNFTMGQGEVAYALSYNISDLDQNGFINEDDAATLYPQGHGDAWGHYLMAIRYYYDLLQNQNYTWYSRSEMVSLEGVTVDVDFHDEQCFAEAAAARAKTGHDILEMTYRKNYTEDPDGQWQGYKDSNDSRAWGVSQWAERAFTGAYYDWVTANAILPENDEDNTGIQKIDRSTVPDLQEITSQARAICELYNQADNGQTPLGIVPDVVPFDIDPVQVDRTYIKPATHFEQIYERAGQALENAFQVFDYANDIKKRIREIADSTQEFLEQTYSQDMEYRNRLIEIFGSPYEGTIGIGQTYPAGYDGPDLYFYNYIDVAEVSDETVPAHSDVLTAMFNSTLASMVEIKSKEGFNIEDFKDSGVSALYTHFFYNDLCEPRDIYKTVTIFNDADDRFYKVRVKVDRWIDCDQLANNPLMLTNYNSTDVSDVLTIEYPMTASEYGFVAPDDWGIRRSPGEIQAALIALVKAEADLQSSLGAYSSLIGDMEWLVQQLGARSTLNEKNLELHDELLDKTNNYNREMDIFQGLAKFFQSSAEFMGDMQDAVVESLPKIAGLSNDPTAPIRAGVKLKYAFASIVPRVSSIVFDSRVDYLESQLELIKLVHAKNIVKVAYHYEIQQQLRELEALFRKESLARLSIFKERENMRQVSEQHKSVLSKGLRLLEERQIFNQRVASKAQGNRYKDMAFRLNHYKALQKYRASFDMAARYVYLAARAYDYETNLSDDHPASAQSLLSKIIKERTLGMIKDNQPMIGFGGLSEILARMKHNYSVLKSRMGFNNPQTETGRFSLRKELFRIKDDQDDIWRDTLSEYRVEDLWDVSEFRRYCRSFAPEAAGPQPGLVIPFASTIEYGSNFFGWPLSGSDHAYDASNFATKVRSVGVWLENYNNSALAETPRVYLVPAGLDVMYVPDSFDLDTREWDIIDQVIPIPLPIGQSDILHSNWIPMISTINEDPTKIRRYSSFRAYHDNGYFNENEMSYDSRLVGRSVWNTRWILIIPGATFLNDPDDGLDTLIYGELVPGSDVTRDENGISDIKLFFQTYANSGG